MKAIEKYVQSGSVEVSTYALERAVKNLPMIEALALIRSAYGEKFQPTTLEEAREIYTAIMTR